MSFQNKLLQKSIGGSKGFNREMTDNSKVLLRKVSYNTERICNDLHEKQAKIRNISLLLIDDDGRKYHTSYAFEAYTAERIFTQKQLTKLLWEIDVPGKLYRKTGVFSSDLQSTKNKQLSLLSLGKHSKESSKLKEVLYIMQKKYGTHILKQ